MSSPPSPSGRSRLINDLEILRGFGLCVVILHHLQGSLLSKTLFTEGPWPSYRGGGAVLDLFFCISGFIITRNLLPQLCGVADSATFWRNARYFWLNRIFRLIPAAWMWLFIILVLCVFYNKSGVFASLETNIAWTLAGVFNYANYLFVQYFGAKQAAASFVYWTLSLEEQFYIALPFLMGLFGRRLQWFMIVVVAVQFVQTRGPYGMLFRTDAIAMGVLVAIWTQNGSWERLLAKLDIRLIRAGLFILLFVLCYIGDLRQYQLPLQVGILALLSGAIVALSIGEKDALHGNWWLPRTLMWAGRRSYSIYLCHIPVMYTMRETAYRLGWNMDNHVLLSIAVCVCLIALVGNASSQWVEWPIRRRGMAFTSRRMARFDSAPAATV
ncbi:MAG: acyltransferase [Pseudomonadota bacterium]